MYSLYTVFRYGPSPDMDILWCYTRYWLRLYYNQAAEHKVQQEVSGGSSE